MTNSHLLTEYVDSAISDTVFSIESYDKDEIEFNIPEFIDRCADNATITYSDCEDIVNQLETHDAAPYESEFGGEFQSHQWREALNRWAYEIAYAVISTEANDKLNQIDEAVDEFIDELADKFNLDVDTDELKLTTSSTLGFAAHNSEDVIDEFTVSYWTSKQLDGLNGAEIDLGAFVLYCLWKPGEEPELA